MKILTGSNLKIQQGRALYQYWASASATLVIITSGMHYGWPSPSLEKFQDPSSGIEISNDEGSWMAVMTLLGALLGSAIVCVTVDILGRKRMILLSSFPYFAAWIMVAYSNSVVVLDVARFIAGVADGWAFTAVPMYIGEIAEPKIRGLLGTGVSVTWIFGILLINIVGSYLSITTTALLSSVLPIISLITFVWMPESPYYLLMRGDREASRKSLQVLRGLEDVDGELNRMAYAVESQVSDSGKFLDLFTVKSNRRAVYVIMILRGFQQMSGTSAITFYTQTIFKEAGSDLSKTVASVIFYSVQLTTAMISSSIVDRAGRRPLLIISIIGSAVMLFIEGTYFFLKSNTDMDFSSLSVIPIVALIVFVVIFNVGMQTIPILMLGELFPANVKAFALCLADIYFSIVATAVSKFFQAMKDTFGIFVPFYVFTGSCLIGLVFIILFVPETKGRTLEEIQLYFKGETGVEKPSRGEAGEKVKEVDFDTKQVSLR